MDALRNSRPARRLRKLWQERPSEQRRQERCKRESEEIRRLAQTGTGEELQSALKNLGHTVQCVDEVHYGDESMGLLQLACVCGNLSTAKALLDLEVSPAGRPHLVLSEVTLSSGKHYQQLHKREVGSCMHLAAREERVEIVDLLKASGHGDFVNARTEDREKITPLMIVALRRSKLCRNQSYHFSSGRGCCYSIYLTCHKRYSFKRCAVFALCFFFFVFFVGFGGERGQGCVGGLIGAPSDYVRCC